MNRRNALRGMGGVGLTILGLWAGTALGGPAQRANNPPPRQGGDTCESAFVIPSLPFADDGTTVGYTNDYDEACPYLGGTAPDVVFAYAPAADVTVDVTLCRNSNYDTKLYVYEDACTAGTAIACNDDECPTPSYPESYVSRIMGLPLTAGHTYYIVVDGYGTASGNYTIDVTAPPPPTQSCPAGTTYGQNVVEPTGDWNAFTSAHTSAFNDLAFDNFLGNTAPACDIHWFGLSLRYNAGWYACDPTGMTFEIKFYPDAGGLPGPEACSYTVAPTITDTGVQYVGYTLFMFDVASLAPCCNLLSGWVSIQSLPNASDCAFLWMSGSGGDALSYWVNQSTGWTTTNAYDLAFCLTGVYAPIFGACCDDAIGTCTDGVEIINCLPPLRFAANVLCADLNPQCGQTPGACCHPDGTCDVTLQSECTDNWLGQYTACSQCPCIVLCPPNTLPEPEDCGAQLDDGCNAEPYVFAPIAPGQTVCGTYWSTPSARDTDWYEYVAPWSVVCYWTVRGTIPTRAFIIDGHTGCPVSGQYWSAAGDACTDVTVASPCLSPGTYWFWVGSSQFVEHSCEQTYVATLTALETYCLYGACCFTGGMCQVLMPTECEAAGGIWQGDFVPCDPNPCPPCTPDFVVTAPGTWTSNTCGAGNRCALRPSEDQIWQVTIPEAGVWHFELCGASFDTYLYVGTTCCGQEVGYDDDSCGTASRVIATLTPGVYYVDVESFSSSVCGEYPLHIFKEEPCIPECPAGSVPEGEPLCGPEYIDNYNGGCGSDPVVFQSIADGQTYCSESGTYTVGGSQYRDTDWYVITVDAPQSVFHLAVIAEFPVGFGMLEQIVPGLPGCENMTGYLAPYANVERCTETVIVSECMPAGTYYFWVGPSVFTDVNCGTRYLATLTITPGTCPTGACCLQTGQCVPEQLEDQCAELLGLWLGDGTACDPNPCMPFPCVAGSLTCDEYIGNVIVGDFSNPSDCGGGGYTDYTNLCIEVRIGSSYDITVENPVPYSADQCGIWIDWNHDIGFDTVTEYIAMTGSPGGGPYTATITPPENAVIGDTVMRIRITYTGILHPCGVTQYGEVEDYCITVTPALCGDFNGDALVNVDDYYAFLDTFGVCTGDPKFLVAADSNGNGCIDLVDYQWWMQCYAAANDGAAFAPPARRPAAPRPAAPPGRDN